MKPATPVILIPLVSSVLLAAAGRQAAAQAVSVEEFLHQKPHWKTLAEKGERITVEGRYASYSRSLIRLHNCDLAFVPQSGEQFPLLARRTGNLELSGKLQAKSRELVFVAAAVREVSSDSRTLQVRKRALRKDRPEDLYRFADWAAGRGRFYSDDELLKEANWAWRRGIEIEHAKLAPQEAAGRLDLAKKAARFGLPDGYRAELVHEAYRIRWKAVRENAAEKGPQLLEQMRSDLPAGKTAPTERNPQLEAQYNRDPHAVYRNADEATRRQLHRLFYETVLLATIEADAKPDGSNGFEIAARIEKELPARKALAESYRQREIRFRDSLVESSGRTAVQELADLYRKRGDSEKADEVITRWLKARTEEMRKDGPAGLMRIAEEYINLHNDRETAAELLKEAYDLSPQSQEIARRLAALGYLLREGKWLTAEEAAKIPLDPIQQAIRDGRVIEGMTADQVREALGGTPQSRTRIASRYDLCELWVYGRLGEARLVVRLRRHPQEPPSAATVIGVTQTRQ